MKTRYHGHSPIFGPIHAAYPSSEKEWLDFRRDFLSASELGAVAGVNKFETIRDVIAKKKSGVPTPSSRVMQQGHDLEPIVAQAVAEKWGWQVQKIDYFLYSRDFKVGASLDYIMQLDDGTWCPLEIKTTSERNLKHGWLSGIPKHYQYQLELQCALFSNDPRGKICVFTRDSKRLMVREVTLSSARIEHLRDIAVGFWQRFDK